MFSLQAFAKINLSLEVVGRRQDGFHELTSVMQTVSLSDTLEFRPDDEFRFTCSDASLAQGNLVERAAMLLRQSSQESRNVSIALHKSIPVAAGLGGGSSDAAAALIGLNRLWNLGLPCADMTRFAAQLGSDVPFFLSGGTCFVSGRGEQVEPLPSGETDVVSAR